MKDYTSISTEELQQVVKELEDALAAARQALNCARDELVNRAKATYREILNDLQNIAEYGFVSIPRNVGGCGVVLTMFTTKEMRIQSCGVSTRVTTYKLFDGEDKLTVTHDFIGVQRFSELRDERENFVYLVDEKTYNDILLALSKKEYTHAGVIQLVEKLYFGGENG